MTRINSIPVAELTPKELGGEWKEIGRVFNLVRARVLKGDRPTDVKAPSEYTLGAGHVTFFYTRLGYIRDRMLELAEEMLNRGHNPNLEMLNDILDDAERDIQHGWWNEYVPTEAAKQLCIARMIENGTRA